MGNALGTSTEAEYNVQTDTCLAASHSPGSRQEFSTAPEANPTVQTF